MERAVVPGCAAHCRLSIASLALSALCFHFVQQPAHASSNTTIPPQTPLQFSPLPHISNDPSSVLALAAGLSRKTAPRLPTTVLPAQQLALRRLHKHEPPLRTPPRRMERACESGMHVRDEMCARHRDWTTGEHRANAVEQRSALRWVLLTSLLRGRCRLRSTNSIVESSKSYVHQPSTKFS